MRGARRLTISLLAFLACAEAGASCLSLQSLDDENDNCLSNGKYVDAGISCFVGFEQRIKAETKKISGLLGESNALHVLGEKNSQSSGLSGSVSDYKIAGRTLDALIAAGRAARSSIDGYRRNIYGPEDFDAPPEVIGSPFEYLNSSPCYAEPRDMLKDMLDRTDAYIADLKRAKKEALTLRDASHDRDTKLGKAKGTRAPASARAVVNKGFKRKKQVEADSTITGVEEDRRKAGR